MNYKGWIIEKEHDAWPRKFGLNFRYYKTPERIYSSIDEEAARIEIDDLTINETWEEEQL